MKSLLNRNVVLVLGIVLLAELVTGLLVNFLVVLPQADRVAGIMARTITVVSETMAAVPPAERARLIRHLSEGSALRIVPATGDPPEGARWPSYLERRYLEALVTQLRRQKGFEWRSDRSRRLWIRVEMAGEPYWLTAEAARGFNPLQTLLELLLIAFAAAAGGGILLQRRIDAPMRRLAAAADRVGTAENLDPLPEEGAREIAAVSRSFNVMTRRLAQAEADRALMLAGISHDLRTPLARLRLVLAMLPHGDAELEDSAVRQVDAIDRMLGQFLDFARGIDAEPLIVTDLAKLMRETLALIGDPDILHVETSGLCIVPVRPESVRRATLNLVANAQRYGKPPILVRVICTDVEARIMVIDHGPGIVDGDAERLTRPFVRGNTARGAGGGTGLGLAIVDRVARSHGGALSFRRPTSGEFEARLTLAIDRSICGG